jgi:putative addiction module component (TIGR02574 family)
MTLPAKLREDIAIELLESVHHPPEDPAEVKKAWQEEIARRIEDIKAGRVQLLDADEVVRQLREEFGEVDE